MPKIVGAPPLLIADDTGDLLRLGTGSRYRIYGDPWYYDTWLVASSNVIPMAPGAVRCYRRGFIK